MRVQSQFRSFVILLIASFFLASGAMAAKQIGAIAAAVGKVSIEREGKVIEVKAGSPVFENDKIITAGKSRAQVLLLDQTAVNVGQKAELTLDEFVYGGDDDKVALKVTKGTFRFISGKVATKTPEKVNVETPVAVIGVRGTEFVGQIDAQDATVALLNGKIEVANDVSTQLVTNPGFGVTIDATSGVISPPVKIPQEQLESVLKSVSTDKDALDQEEADADVEGEPGPDEEGGPDDESGPGPDEEGSPEDEGGPGPSEEGGPEDEGGPGPDGEEGPPPPGGPEDEGGPGPDGEDGPPPPGGPEDEGGPGPDGEDGPPPLGGPGPDGEDGPPPPGGPGPDGADGPPPLGGPGPDGEDGPPPPGGPGPNGQDGPPPPGGPGPDGDFGPGPDGDFGPGPDGDFGPGPDGDFGPGPDGDFGPGPDGDFGPGPGGDFGPGPDGDFGPGPDGDFGPGPDGDFGPNAGPLPPGQDDFANPGGDQFGPGPDGDFGPNDPFTGGPNDFGPGPGGDFGPNDPFAGGPNDFGPGPGGDFGPNDPFAGGPNDFGPGPGGDFGPNDPFAGGPANLGPTDFGTGPLGEQGAFPGQPGFDPGPPQDLFYAGDPNMAPSDAFVLNAFFEGGENPFYDPGPIGGPNDFGPGGSQFTGNPGDFGPPGDQYVPNANDPGSIPPQGPGPDNFGPGGPNDFGPNDPFAGGPNDFGPGPGGDFGPGDPYVGPGPGDPFNGGPNDFGAGPSDPFAPTPGNFGPAAAGADAFGGDYFYDPMAGMGFNDPMGGDGFYDPYAGGGDPYYGGGFNDPYAGGGDPYYGGGFNDPYAGGGDQYYMGGDPYYEPAGYDSFYVDFQFLNDAIQDDTFDEFFQSASEEFAEIQAAIAAGELTFLEFSSPTMLENDDTAVTVAASGGEGTFTFAIAGGADAALFDINPTTGELTLADGSPIAFDFENPQDSDVNNIYQLTLSVTDGVDTVSKTFDATVIDQPLVLASNFDNNFGTINPSFTSFGSEAEFLAAMTDGTLTWNKTFGSGAGKACNAGTCVKVDAVGLVYKTLGKTVKFNIDGGFENAKINGGLDLATGLYSADFAARTVSEFSTLTGAVPGKFTFSSAAEIGTIAANSVLGDSVSITANTINGVGGFSTDVSSDLTLILEAQIGKGTSAEPLAAVVNASVKDSSDTTTSVSVGIGQPSVGN